MEAFEFNVDGILSDEEANKIFENDGDEQRQPENADEIKTPAEEEQEEPESPEKVGKTEEEEEEDATHDGEGTSPDKFYASIAQACREDGIFPDFEDKDFENIKTPEDFADLMEKAIKSRFDERTRRIDEALGNGVAPNTIKAYEQTIQYLGSINPEALSSEEDNAVDLRKQLIYNDLINKGYSSERANREIEKSFKAGSDVDDAKDALESLKADYQKGYQKILDDAKAQAEEQKRRRDENAKTFRKMILEDEIKIGDTKLDKRACQKVYDAVTRPIYKDKTTGQLLTAVQKFQKDNPLEFSKQLGMWYVLTNGGKDLSGIINEQVRIAKNNGIRELSRKINTTNLDGGTMRFAGGDGSHEDPLLSDGWNVDM